MKNGRQVYSEEFRAKAVKLVLEQGQTLLSAAQRFGIPKGMLTNWVLKAKEPGAVMAPGGVSMAEPAAENARLRKELAWVEALLTRRPTNAAIVALANKMARNPFALLAHSRVYDPGYIRDVKSGSRFHVVAVSPYLCDEPMQTFQAFTSDLERMANWLDATG